MKKENRRKIAVPFTLEQFKDAIERIKAEYSNGELQLVGLFEIETLEYYFDVLKELVEKETPKKIKHMTDYYEELDDYYTYEYCPNCHMDYDLYEYLRYCPNCGQRLEWK